jgi:hypothetical protein
MLYGFAELGRFGLGHRLLAWARCVIWCRETGASMLAPGWLSIPVGPWLRRERDKRLYFLLFRSDVYVSGLERLRILATASRIEATDLTRTPLGNADKEQLVVFRNAIAGDADRFLPTFVHHHQLLASELRRMTRPRYVPPASSGPHIAIHVRLGDFAKVNLDKVKAGAHSARLPIEWYAEMLEGVRARLGLKIPAVVYSDGSTEDLAPLLAHANVTRAGDRPAITHMLAMSQADLLIGTGSGMSLWGSLLGQVPRLCFPGQRLVRTCLDEGAEPECESARVIPSAFIEGIGHRLARSP